MSFFSQKMFTLVIQIVGLLYGHYFLYLALSFRWGNVAMAVPKCMASNTGEISSKILQLDHKCTGTTPRELTLSRATLPVERVVMKYVQGCGLHVSTNMSVLRAKLVAKRYPLSAYVRDHSH